MIKIYVFKFLTFLSLTLLSTESSGKLSTDTNLGYDRSRCSTPGANCKKTSHRLNKKKDIGYQVIQGSKLAKFF